MGLCYAQNTIPLDVTDEKGYSILYGRSSVKEDLRR